MYKYIMFILGDLTFALGIYMHLKPKECTKKENRDSVEAVAKTKKSGVLVIVVAIIMELLGVFQLFIS